MDLPKYPRAFSGTPSGKLGSGICSVGLQPHTPCGRGGLWLARPDRGHPARLNHGRLHEFGAISHREHTQGPTSEPERFHERVYRLPVGYCDGLLYPLGSYDGRVLGPLHHAQWAILNAIPEVIYQTQASGLDLLVFSYRFIVENWAEWFVPNVVFTLVGFWLLRLLDPVVAALPSPLFVFVMALAYGLFLTALMIFRGLLFSELNGSNRRARIYKYKMRG